MVGPANDCKDIMEMYAFEVKRVAQQVLGLFAENLHLEVDYFKEKFGSKPMNLMRKNL